MRSPVPAPNAGSRGGEASAITSSARQASALSADTAPTLPRPTGTSALPREVERPTEHTGPQPVLPQLRF
jgi:hypothetical protein